MCNQNLVPPTLSLKTKGWVFSKRHKNGKTTQNADPQQGVGSLDEIKKNKEENRKQTSSGWHWLIENVIQSRGGVGYL